MPSNHLFLCYPLLLLPPIFPNIRVFSNEPALHIRPKYWSFSFSISPSNEYSGLIFLRIDWFDLLAVQGTLKTLLQHHSSKASVLWCSAFFMVHVSHPYMTTGKTSFDYILLSSVAPLCLTLCNPMAARQASISITNFWSWLKLMSIKSVMPPNHLILCYPLLLSSVFPSIRVFSNEEVLLLRPNIGASVRASVVLFLFPK